MKKRQTKHKKLTDAMESAGFSKKAAKNINDFWARFGVDGIQIGSTTLDVDKKPKTKKTK